MVASGTLAPLETEGEEDVRKSDNRVAYCTVNLPRKETFHWESYTYRHYNEYSVDKFKSWIFMNDWRTVLEEEDVDRKTDAYQR